MMTPEQRDAIELAARAEMEIEDLREQLAAAHAVIEHFEAELAELRHTVARALAAARGDVPLAPRRPQEPN